MQVVSISFLLSKIPPSVFIHALIMDFRRRFFIAVVAHLLLPSVLAKNQWLFPTDPGPAQYFTSDLVFTLGSSQTLQWTSNHTDYYVVSLFQQDIRTPNGAGINVGKVCGTFTD